MKLKLFCDVCDVLLAEVDVPYLAENLVDTLGLSLLLCEVCRARLRDSLTPPGHLPKRG